VDVCDAVEIYRCSIDEYFTRFFSTSEVTYQEHFYMVDIMVIKSGKDLLVLRQ